MRVMHGIISAAQMVAIALLFFQNNRLEHALAAVSSRAQASLVSHEQTRQDIIALKTDYAQFTDLRTNLWNYDAAIKNVPVFTRINQDLFVCFTSMISRENDLDERLARIEKPSDAPVGK